MNKNFPETCQDYENGCGKLVIEKKEGNITIQIHCGDTTGCLCSSCHWKYLGYLKGSLERFEETFNYLQSLCYGSFSFKQHCPYNREVMKENLRILSQNIELAKEKIKELE